MHEVKRWISSAAVLLSIVLTGPACSESSKDKTTKPADSTTPTTPESVAKPVGKPQPRSVTPPSDDVGSSAEPGDQGILRTAGVEFDVPAGWIKQEPGSAMRLAQYALPGSTGAAEVVVYYFGQGQGGSRDANIQRWVGQFKNPEDPSKEPKFEVRDVKQGGLDVTIVQVWGTYQPSPMNPGAAAAEPQADHALYGLILEGATTGAVFVKASGPNATIAAHVGELDQFAASARISR